MRALSLWLRRHPMIGDSMVAAFLGFIDGLFFLAGQVRGQAALLTWPIVWFLMIIPLIFRRKRPLLTSYLIMAGGIIQLATWHNGELSVRPSDFALGVALYTLTVYESRRTVAIYSGLLALGTVLWAISIKSGVQAVLPALVLLSCWLLGEFIGARKAYLLETEQRVNLLEREEHHQAQIAVTDERTRIARELHDVVAHAVSVMVVQADGAGMTIGTKPELAKQALENVSNTGRAALAELRQLLDVLRTAEDEQTAMTPQPQVGDLHELINGMRMVGLDVQLDSVGKLDDLPAGLGLSVYRVVQEALTNTLKHAGSRTVAEVRIKRDDKQVEVLVRDQGAGSSITGLSGDSGNGLIGMRERALVFGGSMHAGPRASGGWEVRVTFPIKERQVQDA
ncbi:sensor histidine kinase [Pseudonocardiaceae bacterium YIM PH 21723]|nr:sensor histidine kinase [Pseudonocardiaceae bacterium YIM PH 21723]